MDISITLVSELTMIVYRLEIELYYLRFTMIVQTQFNLCCVSSFGAYKNVRVSSYRGCDSPYKYCMRLLCQLCCVNEFNLNHNPSIQMFILRIII